MLPILRTISVGGVLLAITILGLALTPPGTPPVRFVSVDPPARGVLIDQGQHPEWRHFIMQAALRRAGAIDALRELPDTPMRLPRIPDVAPPYMSPVFPEVWSDEISLRAGLPAPGDHPEEVTGSISAAPAPIPIEIGEPSSTELPAISPDDKPPAIRLPLTDTSNTTSAPVATVSVAEKAEKIEIKPQERRQSVSHRRTRPAEVVTPTATTLPPPFNILQAIFESLLNQPTATDNPKTTRKHRPKTSRVKSTHASSR